MCDIIKIALCLSIQHSVTTFTQLCRLFHLNWKMDFSTREVKKRRTTKEGKNSEFFRTKQHRSKSSTKFWLRYENANNGQQMRVYNFPCVYECVALPLSIALTLTHQISYRHSMVNTRFAENKKIGRKTRQTFVLDWFQIELSTRCLNFLHIRCVHNRVYVCESISLRATIRIATTSDRSSEGVLTQHHSNSNAITFM